MQTDLINPVAAPAAPPTSTEPAESANTVDSTTTPPAKELTLVQKSLTLVKTTVKELDAVEAGMARLRKKFENVVFDLTTTKGMKEATEARATIRDSRYKVQNALAAGKTQLNTLKSDLTTRAEAIAADILTLETPIDQQIKAEEKRKADEKEAKEAADRVRLLAINERISAIRQMASRASACRTAARVQEILTALAAVDLTGFDEFDGEARVAHQMATDTVASVLATKTAEETEREQRRIAQEAEEARLKAAADALAEQQAELARQRKEFEDQQAEFKTQQLAAAREQFSAAVAEHEAKPLPEDASPIQTALHAVAEAAIDAGKAILQGTPAGTDEALAAEEARAPSPAPAPQPEHPGADELDDDVVDAEVGNRAVANENSAYNAKKWRAENGFAEAGILARGDSTQQAKCPQGDGWASVDLTNPQTKAVVVALKCSTVSPNIGCLKAIDFKERAVLANQENTCNAEIPTTLKKIEQ